MTIYGRIILKNGKEAILRELRWNDLYDLYDLQNSIAKEKELEKCLGRQKPKSFEEFLKYFSKIVINTLTGKDIRIVAEVDKKVVGYVSIKISSNCFSHRGWLGIMIRKEYRNLGLGTELLKYAIREAKKRGLKLILLETSSYNKAAIHVFKKVGFKEVGIIPHGLRVNNEYIDTLVMFLKLE